MLPKASFADVMSPSLSANLLLLALVVITIKHLMNLLRGRFAFTRTHVALTSLFVILSTFQIRSSTISIDINININTNILSLFLSS